MELTNHTNLTARGSQPAPGFTEAALLACRALCLAAGLAMNCLCLAAILLPLQRLGGASNRTAGRLLGHQFGIDAFVCLLSLLYSPGWLPDFTSRGGPVVCYLWHTQMVYWFVVALGVGNLLLINWERFTAVARPVTYRSTSKSSILAWQLFGIYLAAISLALPTALYARYDSDNGVCRLGESAIQVATHETLLASHSVLWFVSVYLCPMVAMGIMQARVVFAVKATPSGRGAMELTRTAVAATALFAVTFALDSFYYLIGSLAPGIRYKVNTPLQVASNFMVTLNSCINAPIYVAGVHRLRIRLRHLLTCGGRLGGAASVAPETATADS